MEEINVLSSLTNQIVEPNTEKVQARPTSAKNFPAKKVVKTILKRSPSKPASEGEKRRPQSAPLKKKYDPVVMQVCLHKHDYIHLLFVAIELYSTTKTRV